MKQLRRLWDYLLCWWRGHDLAEHAYYTKKDDRYLTGMSFCLRCGRKT